VAASIARGPAAVARSEPATGPTIHPAVSAIRTIETTPSPTGLAVARRSSWTAANSCEPAAPEKARIRALITKGIHSRSARAIAPQPRNPASAHSRKSPSRLPVRSERAPMRYPATGAVMFVR
jgi:hypothetical protein